MGNRKLNRRQGGSIEHAIAAPFVAAVMTNSLQVNPRRRRSGNRYGLRQAANVVFAEQVDGTPSRRKMAGLHTGNLRLLEPPPARFGGAGPVR
jgi:hypothetical protein